MGGTLNSKISKQNILHFHLPNENRLYLFDTDKELLFEAPVFSQGNPFFFGQLATINCPQKQCLVIIGGRELISGVNFEHSKNTMIPRALGKEKEGSAEDHPTEPQDLPNSEEEKVSEWVEKSEFDVQLYAKVPHFKEDHLQSSCFVGVIDFSNPSSSRLIVESTNIPQLE